ncbi:MAG TPA: DUF2335 domain-containing protein [Verrucomicrobiae bacterium]|jgi:hypothetical protein|nr:DUF2335 domain-containing protein [Verrucomicrobiae bacterium]
MSDGESLSVDKKLPENASLSDPVDLKKIVGSVSPEALKAISPDELEKLASIKAIVVSSERHTHTELSVTHCGPLPPPSYLAKYNEIIPQGADRITKQAEAQSAHRIEIEKRLLQTKVRENQWGNGLGL